MFKNNKIIDPNPYGETSLDALEAFEKEVGAKLPDEYREYLLLYNGARFEHKTFDIKGDAENITDVQVMYGIANEPEWFSIQDSNSYLYDIDVIKKGYLSIGSDAFGNQILIKLKWPNRGAIYFWDHEKPFWRFKSVLLKQADNFVEFVDNLYTHPYDKETSLETLERYKKEDPDTYKLLYAAMKERGEI